MVMRYHWGHGVGHKYSHHSLGSKRTNGSNKPTDDETEDAQAESNKGGPHSAPYDKDEWACKANSVVDNSGDNQYRSYDSNDCDEDYIVDDGESDDDDYEWENEEESSDGASGNSEDDEDLERVEMYGY
jgi:hypothetical protein